jgi:hypothetical protein
MALIIHCNDPVPELYAAFYGYNCGVYDDKSELEIKPTRSPGICHASS